MLTINLFDMLLSSKRAPNCLCKVVRADLKVAKNESDFTLNNGPSRPNSDQDNSDHLMDNSDHFLRTTWTTLWTIRTNI
jgi:hypothetical protein